MLLRNKCFFFTTIRTCFKMSSFLKYIYLNLPANLNGEQLTRKRQITKAHNKTQHLTSSFLPSSSSLLFVSTEHSCSKIRHLLGWNGKPKLKGVKYFISIIIIFNLKYNPLNLLDFTPLEFKFIL